MVTSWHRWEKTGYLVVLLPVNSKFGSQHKQIRDKRKSAPTQYSCFGYQPKYILSKPASWFTFCGKQEVLLSKTSYKYWTNTSACDLESCDGKLYFLKDFLFTVVLIQIFWLCPFCAFSFQLYIKTAELLTHTLLLSYSCTLILW